MTEMHARSGKRSAEKYFSKSPYAAIGFSAAGKFGAIAVTTAQVLTQFSVLVLFFLVSGVNLNKLAPRFSTLFYSLVCAAALTPFMLLKPNHVWSTALFAIFASTALVCVIIYLCASHAPHVPYTPSPPVTFSSFGAAFGVILFGFGGHAILPALQGTLSNPTPSRFRMAIVWSFAICTFMYLSTSIASVVTLGGSINGDVLISFSGTMNDVGLALVTSHLLFAAITVHIPLGQIIDHYAQCKSMSIRQIAARIITMSLVAAIIWLVGDNFYCVVAVVGGTCNNAMIFLMPPFFYYRLISPDQRTTITTIKVVSVMAIGFAGMIASLAGTSDCAS